MDAFVWIAIGIWSILIVIGILALVLRKKWMIKETKGTNYQTFFVMGISFFPLGLVFMILSLTSDFSIGVGLPFFVMGIVYFIIGLANRDKWKGNK